MIDALVARAPFLTCVALWMLGLYLMMAYRNLVKPLVGLSLFQSGIILFFIMLGFREGGSVPIVGVAQPLHNPLPHALMLTAIVVGVATLGVAVAILRRIQAESGGLDDPANGG